jgi:hypothetical protein
MQIREEQIRWMHLYTERRPSEVSPMAEEVADDAAGNPTALADIAGDSGVPAIEAPSNTISATTRPLIRSQNWGRSPPKLPPIHYLETNEHWLNVRWLLMTMRLDVMNSSYYLNDIDIGRRLYKGTASILKRLPIR